MSKMRHMFVQLIGGGYLIHNHLLKSYDLDKVSQQDIDKKFFSCDG